MQQPDKTSTRKKFLLWGAAVLSSLTAFKLITGSRKTRGGAGEKTVKMLTQDGKLVEVDAEKLLFSKREKINDEQLKIWVHKK
jgi:hemerythrin superfamily protein